MDGQPVGAERVGGKDGNEMRRGILGQIMLFLYFGKMENHWRVLLRGDH